MNKKLIALAVGGAIGAIGAPTVALAQSSTVTLSGTINVLYGYFDNGGAGFSTPVQTSTVAGNAKVRTDSMANSEGEWVLKGQENLGGGMAAHFMCSTTFDPVAASASNMCGRNSYIGLKGNFGNVYFGNYDTPIKTMMANYRPFALTYPVGAGLLFNQSGSNVTNTSDATSFSRRQNRLVTYAMPTMNGFDAQFAYSTANEATGNTSASTIQKPRLWSAMVNYTNGPLMLGAGYERHIDYNPAAQATYTGGRDNSYQLGAAYTFMGSLKVSAMYANLKYETAGGTDLSQNNYGLYADWAISGPHRIRAGYSNMGSTKGSFAGTTTAGTTLGTLTGNGGAGQTGAQKYHFEYAYALSKRTEWSLGYARQNNDRSANIPVGTGSNTPNFGETQSYVGMRIKHAF
jgi:predicted porin